MEVLGVREGEWKESKRGNTVQSVYIYHICKYVTFYESERESKGGRKIRGGIQSSVHINLFTHLFL